MSDLVRAIFVPDDDTQPVRIVNAPNTIYELARLDEMGFGLKGFVECDADVNAVYFDQPPPGSGPNPRATQAVTMLVPGFSNTNMFVGGVVFFGPSNDEGEFLDLDPEWDKKLFPAIPVEPLT